MNLHKLLLLVSSGVPAVYSATLGDSVANATASTADSSVDSLGTDSDDDTLKIIADDTSLQRDIGLWTAVSLCEDSSEIKDKCEEYRGKAKTTAEWKKLCRSTAMVAFGVDDPSGYLAQNSTEDSIQALMPLRQRCPVSCAACPENSIITLTPFEYQYNSTVDYYVIDSIFNTCSGNEDCIRALAPRMCTPMPFVRYQCLVAAQANESSQLCDATLRTLDNSIQGHTFTYKFADPMSLLLKSDYGSDISRDDCYLGCGCEGISLLEMYEIWCEVGLDPQAFPGYAMVMNMLQDQKFEDFADRLDDLANSIGLSTVGMEDYDIQGVVVVGADGSLRVPGFKLGDAKLAKQRSIMSLAMAPLTSASDQVSQQASSAASSVAVMSASAVTSATSSTSTSSSTADEDSETTTPDPSSYFAKLGFDQKYSSYVFEDGLDLSQSPDDILDALLLKVARAAEPSWMSDDMVTLNELNLAIEAMGRPGILSSNATLALLSISSGGNATEVLRNMTAIIANQTNTVSPSLNNSTSIKSFDGTNSVLSPGTLAADAEDAYFKDLEAKLSQLTPTQRATAERITVMIRAQQALAAVQPNSGIFGAFGARGSYGVGGSLSGDYIKGDTSDGLISSLGSSLGDWFSKVLNNEITILRNRYDEKNLPAFLSKLGFFNGLGEPLEDSIALELMQVFIEILADSKSVQRMMVCENDPRFALTCGYIQGRISAAEDALDARKTLCRSPLKSILRETNLHVDLNAAAAYPENDFLDEVPAGAACRMQCGYGCDSSDMLALLLELSENKYLKEMRDAIINYANALKNAQLSMNNSTQSTDDSDTGVKFREAPRVITRIGCQDADETFCGNVNKLSESALSSICTAQTTLQSVAQSLDMAFPSAYASEALKDFCPSVCICRGGVTSALQVDENAEAPFYLTSQALVHIQAPAAYVMAVSSTDSSDTGSALVVDEEATAAQETVDIVILDDEYVASGFGINVTTTFEVSFAQRGALSKLAYNTQIENPNPGKVPPGLVQATNAGFVLGSESVLSTNAPYKYHALPVILVEKDVGDVDDYYSFTYNGSLYNSTVNPIETQAKYLEIREQASLTNATREAAILLLNETKSGIPIDALLFLDDEDGLEAYQDALSSYRERQFRIDNYNDLMAEQLHPIDDFVFIAFPDILSVDPDDIVYYNDTSSNSTTNSTLISERNKIISLSKKTIDTTNKTLAIMPSDMEGIIQIPNVYVGTGRLAGSNSLRLKSGLFVVSGVGKDSNSIPNTLGTSILKLLNNLIIQENLSSNSSSFVQTSSKSNSTSTDDDDSTDTDTTSYNVTAYVPESHRLYITTPNKVPDTAVIIQDLKLYYTQSTAKTDTVIGNLVAEMTGREVIKAGFPLLLTDYVPVLRRKQYDTDYDLSVGLPFTSLEVYSLDKSDPCEATKNSTTPTDMSEVTQGYKIGGSSWLSSLLGIDAETLANFPDASFYLIFYQFEEIFGRYSLLNLLGPTQLHVDAIMKTFVTPSPYSMPGMCQDSLGSYCSIVRISPQVCAAPISDFLRDLFSMADSTTYGDSCRASCNTCSLTLDDLPLIEALPNSNTTVPNATTSTRILLNQSIVLATAVKPLRFAKKALELSEYALYVGVKMPKAEDGSLAPNPNIFFIKSEHGVQWSLKAPELASKDGTEGVWLIQSSHRLIGPFELRMSPATGALLLVDNGHPTVYPDTYDTDAHGRVVWVSHKGYLPGVRQGELVFPALVASQGKTGLGLIAGSGDLIWRGAQANGGFLPEGAYPMRGFVRIDRYQSLIIDWSDIFLTSDTTVTDRMSSVVSSVRTDDAVSVLKARHSIEFTLNIPESLPLPLYVNAIERTGRFILKTDVNMTRFNDGNITDPIPLSSMDSLGAWYLDGRFAPQAKPSMPSPDVDKDWLGVPAVALLPDGNIAIVRASPRVQNSTVYIDTDIVWVSSDVPQVTLTETIISINSFDGRPRPALIPARGGNAAPGVTVAVAPQISEALSNAGGNLMDAAANAKNLLPNIRIWSDVTDATESLLRAIDQQVTKITLDELANRGSVDFISNSQIDGWAQDLDVGVTVLVDTANPELILTLDDNLNSTVRTMWTPHMDCDITKKTCDGDSSTDATDFAIRIVQGIPELISGSSVVWKSPIPASDESELCEPETDRLVFLADGSLAVLCDTSEPLPSIRDGNVFYNNTGLEARGGVRTVVSWMSSAFVQPLAADEASVKLAAISKFGRAALAIIDISTSEILWSSDASGSSTLKWQATIFSSKSFTVSNGIKWSTVISSTDSATQVSKNGNSTLVFGFTSGGRHVELYEEESGESSWSTKNDIGHHHYPISFDSVLSKGGRDLMISNDGRLALINHGTEPFKYRMIWSSVGPRDATPVSAPFTAQAMVDGKFYFQLATTAGRDGHRSIAVWSREGSASAGQSDDITQLVVKPVTKPLSLNEASEIDSSAIPVVIVSETRAPYNRRIWRGIGLGDKGAVIGTPFFTAGAIPPYINPATGFVNSTLIPAPVTSIAFGQGGFNLTVNQRTAALELYSDSQKLLWSSSPSFQKLTTSAVVDDEDSSNSTSTTTLGANTTTTSATTTAARRSLPPTMGAADGWVVDPNRIPPPTTHSYEMRLLKDGNLGVFAVRKDVRNNPVTGTVGLKNPHSSKVTVDSLVWASGVSTVETFASPAVSSRIALKTNIGSVAVAIMFEGTTPIWESDVAICTTIKCSSEKIWLPDDSDFVLNPYPMSVDDLTSKRLLVGRSQLYLGDSGFIMRLRDDGILEVVDAVGSRVVWASSNAKSIIGSAPFTLEVTSNGQLAILDAQRNTVDTFGDSIDTSVFSKAYLAIESSETTGDSRLIAVDVSGITIWETSWQSFAAVSRLPEIIWSVAVSSPETSVFVNNTIPLLNSTRPYLDPLSFTLLGKSSVDAYFSLAPAALSLIDGRNGDILWSSSSPRAGGILIPSNVVVDPIASSLPTSQADLKKTSVRQTVDGRIAVFYQDKLIWISSRSPLTMPTTPQSLLPTSVGIGFSVSVDGAVSPALCLSLTPQLNLTDIAQSQIAKSNNKNAALAGIAVWTASSRRPLSASRRGCHLAHPGVTPPRRWDEITVSDLHADKVSPYDASQTRTFVLAEGFLRATSGGDYYLQVGQRAISLFASSGATLWSSALPHAGGKQKRLGFFNLRQPSDNLLSKQTETTTLVEEGAKCKLAFKLDGNIVLFCGKQKRIVWATDTGFALPNDALLSICAVESPGASARFGICTSDGSVVWISGGLSLQSTSIPAGATLNFADQVNSMDIVGRNAFDKAREGLLLLTSKAPTLISSQNNVDVAALLSIDRSTSSLTLTTLEAGSRIWAVPLRLNGDTSTSIADSNALPDVLLGRLLPDGSFVVVDVAGRSYFHASAGSRRIGDAVCLAFSIGSNGQVQLALASPTGNSIYWKATAASDTLTLRVVAERADVVVSNALCLHVSAEDPSKQPATEITSHSFGSDVKTTISFTGAMEFRNALNGQLLWSSDGLDVTGAGSSRVSTSLTGSQTYTRLSMAEFADGNIGVINANTHETIWKTSKAELSSSEVASAARTELAILREASTKSFIAPVLVETHLDGSGVEVPIIVWRGSEQTPKYKRLNCETDEILSWSSSPSFTASNFSDGRPSWTVIRALNNDTSSNYSLVLGADGVLRLISKIDGYPAWESNAPQYMSGYSGFRLAVHPIHGTLAIIAGPRNAESVIWMAASSPSFITSSSFVLRVCFDSEKRPRPIIFDGISQGMLWIGASPVVGSMSEVASLYTRETLPAAPLAARPKGYEDALATVSSDARRSPYTGEVTNRYRFSTGADDCALEILDQFNGDKLIWSSSGAFKSVLDGNGGLILLSVDRKFTTDTLSTGVNSTSSSLSDVSSGSVDEDEDSTTYLGKTLRAASKTDQQIRCRIDQLSNGQLAVSAFSPSMLLPSGTPIVSRSWVTGLDSICYDCSISAAISHRPGRRDSLVLLVKFSNDTEVVAWRGRRIPVTAEYENAEANSTALLSDDSTTSTTTKSSSSSSDSASHIDFNATLYTTAEINAAIAAEFGTIPDGTDSTDEDDYPTGILLAPFSDETFTRTDFVTNIPEQSLESIIGRATLRSGDAFSTPAGVMRLRETGVVELRDELSGLLRWVSHTPEDLSKATAFDYELRMLVDGNIAVLGRRKTINLDDIIAAAAANQGRMNETELQRPFVVWATQRTPLRFSSSIRFIFEELKSSGAIRAAIRGDGDDLLWSSDWQSHGSREMKAAAAPALVPVSSRNIWGVRTAVLGDLESGVDVKLSIDKKGNIHLSDNQVDIPTRLWSSLEWGERLSLPIKDSYSIRQAANGHLAAVSTSGHVRWISGRQALIKSGLIPRPAVIRNIYETSTVYLVIMDVVSKTVLWPGGVVYSADKFNIAFINLEEDETLSETIESASTVLHATSIPVSGTDFVFRPTSTGGLALIDHRRGDAVVWNSEGRGTATLPDPKSFQLSRVRNGETGAEFIRGDGITFSVGKGRSGAQVVRLTVDRLDVRCMSMIQENLQASLGVSEVIECTYADSSNELDSFKVTETGPILDGTWEIISSVPGSTSLSASSIIFKKVSSLNFKVIVDGTSGKISIEETTQGGCTSTFTIPDDTSVAASIVTVDSTSQTADGSENSVVVSSRKGQVTSGCIKAPMEVIPLANNRWGGKFDSCSIVKGIVSCSGVVMSDLTSEKLVLPKPLYSSTSSVWERKQKAFQKFLELRQKNGFLTTNLETIVDAASSSNTTLPGTPTELESSASTFSLESDDAWSLSLDHTAQQARTLKNFVPLKAILDTDKAAAAASSTSTVTKGESVIYLAPSSSSVVSTYAIRLTASGNIYVVDQLTGVVTWTASARAPASATIGSSPVQLVVVASPIGSPVPSLMSLTDGSLLWEATPTDTRVLPMGAGAGGSDGLLSDRSSLDVPNLPVKITVSMKGELQFKNTTSDKIVWSAFGQAQAHGSIGASGSGGVWLRVPKAEDGPYAIRFQPDGNLAVVAKGVTPNAIVWVTSQIPMPRGLEVDFVLQRHPTSLRMRPAIVKANSTETLWAGANLDGFLVKNTTWVNDYKYTLPTGDDSVDFAVGSNATRSASIWTRYTERTGTPDFSSLMSSASLAVNALSAPGIACSLASLDTSKYMINELVNGTIVVRCQPGLEPSGLSNNEYMETLVCSNTTGIIRIPDLTCAAPVLSVDGVARCPHPSTSLSSTYAVDMSTYTTETSEYADTVDASVVIKCADGYTRDKTIVRNAINRLNIDIADDASDQETLTCLNGVWSNPQELKCTSACPSIDVEARYQIDEERNYKQQVSDDNLSDVSKAVKEVNEDVKYIIDPNQIDELYLKCSNGYASRALIDWRRNLKSNSKISSSGQSLLNGSAQCSNGKWVTDLDCLGTGRFGITLGGTASAVSTVGVIVAAGDLSASSTDAARQQLKASMSQWSASLVPYVEAALKATGDSTGRANIFRAAIQQKVQPRVPSIVKSRGNLPSASKSKDRYMATFDLENSMTEVKPPAATLSAVKNLDSTSAAKSTVTLSANRTTELQDTIVKFETMLTTRTRTIDVGCFVIPSGSEGRYNAFNKTLLDIQMNSAYDVSSMGSDGYGRYMVDCLDGVLASLSIYRRTTRGDELVDDAASNGIHSLLSASFVAEIQETARLVSRSSSTISPSELQFSVNATQETINEKLLKSIKMRSGGAKLLALLRTAQDRLGLIGFYLATPELLKLSTTATDGKLRVSSWTNLLSLLPQLDVTKRPSSPFPSRPERLQYLPDETDASANSTVSSNSTAVASQNDTLISPSPDSEAISEPILADGMVKPTVTVDPYASSSANVNTTENILSLSAVSGQEQLHENAALILATPLPSLIQPVEAYQPQYNPGIGVVFDGLTSHFSASDIPVLYTGLPFPMPASLSDVDLLARSQRTFSDGGVTVSADFTVDGPLGAAQSILSERWPGCDSTTSILGRLQVGIDVGEGSSLGTKSSVKQWLSESCGDSN